MSGIVFILDENLQTNPARAPCARSARRCTGGRSRAYIDMLNGCGPRSTFRVVKQCKSSIHLDVPPRGVSHHCRPPGWGRTCSMARNGDMPSAHTFSHQAGSYLHGIARLTPPSAVSLLPTTFHFQTFGANSSLPQRPPGT